MICVLIDSDHSCLTSSGTAEHAANTNARRSGKMRFDLSGMPYALQLTLHTLYTWMACAFVICKVVYDLNMFELICVGLGRSHDDR
jgi:hypothetical protein